MVPDRLRGRSRRWPRARRARPPGRPPRAARSGSMLSSRSRGAPAASASSISSASRHSTSSGRSGNGARGALGPPPPTPPAAAMWFSLIRIASNRPKRWFVPPPARTAAFSSARRPGVVLRVSRIRAPVPSTARTYARRQRRDAAEALQEVQRGALAGQERGGAARDAQHGPPGSRHSPSGARRSIATSASSCAERLLGGVEAEDDARRLLRDRGASRARLGRPSPRVVTSPAPTSSASARATTSATKRGSRVMGRQR